ncbi:unnamed protein product [Discosporangium mesarthrocarpum]
MDHLGVEVADCSMAWLINLLTRLFAGTIKAYVRSSLLDELIQNASHLLGTINAFADGYWPLLLSLVNAELHHLPQASAEELAQARGEGATDTLPQRQGGGRGRRSHSDEDLKAFLGEGGLRGLVSEDFGVVFHEDGPLGLQIDLVEGERPRVVVTNLHPGGQADRLMASSKSALVGSEIIHVGDAGIAERDAQGILDLLRHPDRPVRIVFRHYVVRVEEEGEGGAASRVKGAGVGTAAGGDLSPPPPPRSLVTARFSQQSLGIRYRPSPSLGNRVIEVGGFTRDPDGKMRAAEASGLMEVGQLLFSVNGKRVLGQTFDAVVKLLSGIGRPVKFGLIPGPYVTIRVTAPPDDVKLDWISGHIVVTGYRKVPSPLECSGRVSVGDTIISANGIRLPTSAGYDRDMSTLRSVNMYPLKLRLQEQPQMNRGSIITDVILPRLEDLDALELMKGPSGAPMVRSFVLVKGDTHRSGLVPPGAILLGVGGEPLLAHITTAFDCAMLLRSIEYPCDLRFRDINAYMEVARYLSLPPDTEE